MWADGVVRLVDGTSKGGDFRGWVERFVLRLGLCPWQRSPQRMALCSSSRARRLNPTRSVTLHTGNLDGCDDACVVSPPRSSRALTPVYGKRIFAQLMLGAHKKHLKNGVYTLKLWVKGVKHDRTVNPKSEELGTLSGGNRRARLYVPRVNPLIAPFHVYQLQRHPTKGQP